MELVATTGITKPKPLDKSTISIFLAEGPGKSGTSNHDAAFETEIATLGYSTGSCYGPPFAVCCLAAGSGSTRDWINPPITVGTASTKDRNREATLREKLDTFPGWEDESLNDRQQLHLGELLYRQFNRFGPARIERIHHPRLIPPVVVELGELAGLIYRSDKWQPGRPRTYIHFMENPPRLVSNVKGTQLYIIGGNYKITTRGIEG